MSASLNSCIAIVAHPDDIEFRCAGTLLQLKQAGWEVHYLSVSSGSLGSTTMSAEETQKTRAREAQHAAKMLGAHWHPSLADDLEITYDLKLLRRIAAIIRDVKPRIVLTHPPVDYMEDHTSTCRLAVTAAFSRGMPNFRTEPQRPHFDGEITVYHCTPHGLCDPLGRPVAPEFFINTSPVYEAKLQALAAHESQRGWLSASQGMDSYLAAMDAESQALGLMTEVFRHAEGWWRHSHLGFCAENADPLRDALPSHYLANKRYTRGLELKL